MHHPKAWMLCVTKLKKLPRRYRRESLKQVTRYARRREYYQQGREKVQVLEQTLEAQIRAKPIQSLLIAGGIGLLLGLLWNRR